MDGFGGLAGRQAGGPACRVFCGSLRCPR